MLDLERFVQGGLAECLHLKFMQIETAFQENQLQMLKINDNFAKLQNLLGEDECDFEPIDLESMFEFTSSILEDIQNKIFIQNSNSKREEDQASHSIDKEVKMHNSINSGAYKSSPPDKNSDANNRVNTTSDANTNREHTDDGVDYEVINAKRYHKETEFNQFDSIKDCNMISRSDNSPVSITEYSSQLRDKPQETVNNIPKHPSTTKNITKQTGSRIPGVKNNSVSRPNNNLMKEETKKHKGKTPSFGNANSPLFLNNFQIDTEANIVVEQNTRESRKEETKNDRRTFSGKGSADLTDKFTSPILSHRDTRKTVPKKSVTRPGQRPRPLSKKTSPYHNKSAAASASTPKPSVSGIVSVINIGI
jgi:hypothetical protein